MWSLENPWGLGLPLALATAAAMLLAPAEADACGGTFCDAFTPEMAVDQTGEVILFVSDGDYVEAHVQIQYDGGDAQQFAWLVPVPAVPEIEVGSWRLVNAAMLATQPVYDYENNYSCEGPETTGIGFIRDPDGGGVSVDPGVDPTVVAQDVVGAFEYAVLQGGSADTVNTWLVDNGYATDEQAPEILDAYIAEGSVFVAFRLRHGAEVEDIHPVVIRYQGTEPCIPLRLTGIAAKEDMDITALFLGDTRVVPTNYRHVVLNDLRIDWMDTTGESYPTLVSMAVDAPGANGRAFVTEYAGSTNAIDGSSLNVDEYDPSVFVTMPVVQVVDALQAQGLADCDDDGCIYRHELVGSLLHEFIPVPAGIEDDQFYGCLSCYAQLIDATAWDGAAFAMAYQERIIDPLLHGQALLDLWPYVTRLYTRISPHEMLADPTFAEHEGLANVPNRHGMRRDVDCCGAVAVLPDGRRVALPDYWWPTWSNAMPWAARIEEFVEGGGAPVVVVDETATIEAQLNAWNAQSECGPGGGTAGGVDSTAGTFEDETGVTPDDTGGGGTSGAGQDDPPSAGGCGCSQRSSGAGSWLTLVLGLGLGLARRRRA